MISNVFVIVAIFLWFYMLWRRRKYYQLCFKVPGPLGYPILGMAHALKKREDILKNFEAYEEVHGRFFYSWLGPSPILIVAEPQIVQDILTSPNCVNKGFMYEVVNECTGRGLFGLKDPEWNRHRKLLNPAFNYKALAGLMPIFNEEVRKLLQIFGGNCEKGEIDITNILQSFSLSLATKTTMGMDLSLESSNNAGLLESYHSLLEIMTEMCFTPWMRLKLVRWLFGKEVPYVRAKSRIRLFIRRLIARNMTNTVSESAMQAPVVRSNFLTLAIEHLRKGGFTYENVEDESNVIVLGAFETTSNTIAYTLMLLAMFPCYQQKLFEEIKSLYPDIGDFEVTMSEMQLLVYMDMVLNEVMRVMAPVPLIAREVSKDMTLSNGVAVPAGVQIAIDIFNMHRRKDIWGPDAHKFNPENFLPTNLEEKHSYAFIPFTKGVRNCIGWRYALLSIKVVLIRLIRNFEFNTTFIFEDLSFVEDITLKLKKTPMLKITRRES